MTISKQGGGIFITKCSDPKTTVLERNRAPPECLWQKLPTVNQLLQNCKIDIIVDNLRFAVDKFILMRVSDGKIFTRREDGIVVFLRIQVCYSFSPNVVRVCCFTRP